MDDKNYKRFEHLTFQDFRRMAADDSLSSYEKIGFPNSYREGRERAIFEDISFKLPALSERGKTVLDIGPGCSELPLMLIEACKDNGHELLLIDSEEMLSRLPDTPGAKKIVGYYPECEAALSSYIGRIDVIVTYSVLHYVFAESNIFSFLDLSLSLLAPGGQMLIGDVPNISKRNRFFSSAAGIKFHQEFTETDEIPEVAFSRINRGQIDDAVVLALLTRARNQGFDAYVIPQRDDLPMANRREDILIRRP